MTNLKKSSWVIPFKGRNTSSSSNVNFLWNEDNIYIMDNHLMAAWCWAQEFEKNQTFGIIHIDEHYDLNRLNGKNGNDLKPLKELSIQEYIGLEEKFISTIFKSIQWDNYFTIFLDQYSKNVNRLIFATCQEMANESNRIIDDEWSVEKLLRYLKIELDNEDEGYDNKTHKWIINVDIDYFFCESISKFDATKTIQFQSNEYIIEFASILKNALQKNKILCLTISLSPECCGGWVNAESICEIITNKIGINFKLE